MAFRNFEYKIQKKPPKKVVWVCCNKPRTQCRALCVTFDNILEMKQQHHNHPPNFDGSIKNLQSVAMTINNRK